MGLFSKKPTDLQHGLVVDIGSGSVVISIVTSNKSLAYPEIIWSRREPIPRNSDETDSESAQRVMSTMLQAMLYVDNKGYPALQERYQGARVTHMQVSVAAPWSYTITKNISYSDKEEFVISKDIVKDLESAARQKTLDELDENELAKELGLTIMTRATTAVSANGYVIKNPYAEKAKSLSLSHVTAVTQQALADTITETHQKVAPRAALQTYSYMLLYYAVIRDLFKHMSDFCLIDVTYEATEMGIVRDGKLQYCTHVPTGVMTLARKIAKSTKTPVGEVFSSFRNKDVRERLLASNPKLKTQYDLVTEQYAQELKDLFNETGDALSIPKNMFIHTELYTEDVFQTLISDASQRATKVQHVVYSISRELLTKQYEKEVRERLWKATTETSLLVSAQFFHNQTHGDSIAGIW